MSNELLSFKNIATFLIGICAALISVSSHADWTITGLGTLGGSYSYARAINDSGQIVGGAQTVDGNDHPFITSSNEAVMTDLSAVVGLSSNAYGINDSGQVVGASIAADGFQHAYITGANGVGMIDLGTLGGLRSFAYDINDSGQVAGASQADPHYLYANYHDFITGANGVGMTDLGNLGGYPIAARPNAINDSGQVTGTSLTADGFQHAYITGANGVGMIDLGTLGGHGSSIGADTNNSGQVVGSSHFADGEGNMHAFITGNNGANMTDLGTLGGYNSHAYRINDLGEVVGSAQTADGNYDAFIFSHGGLTNLSHLDVVVAAGWANLNITDINNHGQIVGWGILNGYTQAFLLSYSLDTVFTPLPIFIPVLEVPEPETYSMLLAGLAVIAFSVCRRI